MKFFIIWKISIAGWSKEIVAIFKDKGNALRFKHELQSMPQYYYEMSEENTKD
ncbi:hypothetical protein ACUXCC_000876 [Cytobacillus horneckiae]|uniref:hypothetical protein n=1 Tax=Cytobacillus horneckiae TaxID=549687 RepID=UPI0019D2B023|nr:hypothetical protein [Cytobacillus horneckiae]MBN6886219.1 hypothetical protein [Cytobacillus horneckiae]MCM3179723.1 hypothetical protein [Cytobacillus horneckiae]